jgi:hypothetical protein
MAAAAYFHRRNGIGVKQFQRDTNYPSFPIIVAVACAHVVLPCHCFMVVGADLFAKPYQAIGEQLLWHALIKIEEYDQAQVKPKYDNSVVCASRHDSRLSALGVGAFSGGERSNFDATWITPK